MRKAHKGRFDGEYEETQHGFGAFTVVYFFDCNGNLVGEQWESDRGFKHIHYSS
jgi:hypothetical protein